MRISTWNLESCNARSPAREEFFRQAMADVCADIWVLTETWFGFCPCDGYRLVSQSSEAEDLGTGSNRCWVSIWAKSCFNSRSYDIRCQPQRMACGRIEIPGQMDIVAVGTVLPWVSDKSFLGTDGFCKAVREQDDDWAPHQTGLEPCAYLVAGDFNQSLPHISRYGSKDGETAVNSVLEKHGLRCFTESKVLPSGKPMIDHICFSQSCLKSKSVPNVGTWDTPLINEKPITDHVGVFVDLEVS